MCEVRVLLADDSEVLCRAIKTLLSREPRIEISGETRTFAQTVEAATNLHPNVILLDLHMPTGDMDFEFSTTRSRLLNCCERVVAISLANDAETNALAELYGAERLLNKANLASELIPALLPSGVSLSTATT